MSPEGQKVTQRSVKYGTNYQNSCSLNHIFQSGKLSQTTKCILVTLSLVSFFN